MIFIELPGCCCLYFTLRLSFNTNILIEKYFQIDELKFNIDNIYINIIIETSIDINIYLNNYNL